MKGKKLLAGSLSAAMVIGTMVVPAFADEDNYATIGDDTTHYDTLKAAVDAAEDGATIKIYGKVAVSDGDIPKSKTFTFVKGGDNAELTFFKGTSGEWSSGYYVDGSKLTFENLILTWSSSVEGIGYQGFVRPSLITYNDCTINNEFYLGGEKQVFNDCTFEQSSSGKYNVWTYGAKYVEFNDCTFNSAGKSVLIYNEGAVGSETVNVKDCTFNASTPVKGKAAIEIDSRFVDYELNIDGNTTVQGFGTGSNSGNSLYNVKDYDKDSVKKDSQDNSKKLNVEIKVDGEVVMPFSDEKMAEVFGNVVAQNGSKFYETLKDAVAAAESGDTVKLLADSNGDGITIPSGSNLTIDFGGHTYTVDGALVGSPGYESQAFHLSKDSTIKFMNGTITSKKAKLLVQNYSNLTLDGVTLDGTNLAPAEYGSPAVPGPNYTLSNNNGNIVITGKTNIFASEGNFAFDVCRNSNYQGVSVTLDDNMTGTIKGKIEVDGTKNAGEKFELIIKNGEINGEIAPTARARDFNVAISGGSFSTDISDYCADGYKPTKVNGRYVVGQDDSTDEISLKFEKVDDRTYDIVLESADKEIHKLNAAQFKFELNKENPTDVITYEIAPVKEMALIPQKDDVYELHFDGKDGVVPDSGNTVKIGTVTFEGFGKFTFGATEGKVTATTGKNNLVTEFVVGGSASKKGELVLGTPEDIELTVPQHKLTINIAMNHKVTDNKTDYQDMKVEISGGNLGTNTKKYELGEDGIGLANGVYTITENLDENGFYTVTVKGAGYRTARYTVTMTGDKTMNLWNNVMTAPTEVVVGTGETTQTNFLAGDIIRDNIINIYDLSAVVAYFGSNNLVTAHPTYAKYDLNRDGVIDMMDISIVLTSWGN